MTPGNGNGNGNGSGKVNPAGLRGQWVLNAAFTALRDRLSRYLTDPRRSVEDECGYPEPGAYVSPHLYQRLYEREPLPARVVECLPRESWQVQPEIFESEDGGTVTPFERAWDALGKQLRGEKSWHQDEAGSPVWEYLLRADILSGIGQYGVILLGLDDGQDMSTPARTRQGARLLYLRVFPEALAQIARFETDVKSPRFGKPVEYNLTFHDPSEGGQAGVGLPISTRQVHWSRVVHIADNLGSNEVFGVPRMRPVLHRLLDLQKIYAASGETFWRNCVLKLFFETHPQLGGDVDIDHAQMKDDVEEMMNGLQQWMTLRGMQAKSIAPAVVDPTPHAQAQIQAICIKLGVPQRVFMGSERGELASSQDDAAWNDRLKERQKNYLTPKVIVPFVDRLIQLGVLPEPSGYSVRWPDLTSTSETDRASLAALKTGALAQYKSAGLEALMSPLDYYTRVWGMGEEEATAVLARAQATAAPAPAPGAAPPPPEAEPAGNADEGEAEPEPADLPPPPPRLDLGPLLTAREAAEHLRVSPAKILSLVRAGAVRAYRFGASIRIPERSLAEYVEASAGPVANAGLAAAFPESTQTTDYSCGAACLAAVCRHFGLSRTEAECMELLGTDPEAGTTMQALASVSRQLGLSVEEFADDDEEASGLRRHLAEGRPVICPVQMHGETAAYDSEEALDLSGHYVVVLAVGPEGESGLGVDPSVTLEDPSARGRVTMPLARFVEIWHDADVAGERYRRAGLAFGEGGDFAANAPKKGTCKPGERASVTGCTPAGKAGGAKAGGKGKGAAKAAPKPTADSVHAEIHGLLTSGKRLDKRHVAKIAASLQTLTVKDIQAVKAKLGVKASGAKAELAAKVAEQAVAAARERLKAGKPAPAKAPPKGEAVGASRLADGTAVSFVPHPNQRPDETTVMVDPKKLDAAWSQDSMHIPPGGEGVKGRRAEVERFLAKGEPIQASRGGVGPDGVPYFVDGRHRFAALRDKGAAAVAVTVPKKQAAEITSRFGPGEAAKPASPAPAPKPAAPAAPSGAAALADPARRDEVRDLARRAGAISTPHTGGEPFGDLKVLHDQLKKIHPDLSDKDMAALAQHLHDRKDSGVEFHPVNGLHREVSPELSAYYKRVTPSAGGGTSDARDRAAILVRDPAKLAAAVQDFFAQRKGK